MHTTVAQQASFSLNHLQLKRVERCCYYIRLDNLAVTRTRQFPVHMLLSKTVALLSLLVANDGLEEVAVDTNCGLLGDYKPATHECRCDIGWTGRNCTLPSLELAPVATTSSQAYVILLCRVLLCRVRLVISPSLISRTPAQPCRTVARTASYDPRWCSQACSPRTIGSNVTFRY